jgi:hypothetical protein
MNIFIILGGILLGYGVSVEVKKRKKPVAAAPEAAPKPVEPKEVDPLKNVQTP